MSIDAQPDRDAEAGPRRRGLAFVVAAAVLVVAAGLAVWLWPRDDDPRTAATEAALDRALAVGGPQGWASAEPVSLMLPQADQTGETESRDGVLVGITRDGDAETGFTATWTIETASSAACDALVTWAVRQVPTTDADDTRSNCQGGGSGLFASAGTEVDGSGRWMFTAAADENNQLTATLTFKAA
ncbi:hypothetical protein JIG36_45855 [Actinoplanes sp. LDG1-06]|uniref:Uncharacterized protein n=1 Tax=Paractinoplanes ovalisporus TaxID=2810368 RepID=A0ABS2AUG3_9ACTN|nr:hypothetical protein [Actinoplanes ovalisporus]MBM2622851.1 hypothetical protein [Actinoplanes ovalisporus]